MNVRFLPSGDTALTVQFDGVMDRALSRQVISLSRQLNREIIPGFIEAVPTYRSLLVHYSPLQTTQHELINCLESLIDDLPVADSTHGKHWKLPVCFEGPAFAQDLDEVAAWSDISTDEVIDTLLTTQLYVYMLGFAAGQPYLGDLPETLAIPRRTTPVSHMPAGSILVATGKLVIYPFDNPTGWYAIGRTPVLLFDLARDPVCLFDAGDTAEFYRISCDEYRAFDRLAVAELTS